MATAHQHEHDASAAPAEVLDPVCGMMIDPADAAATYDYKGQTYYFCMQDCADRFQAEPEKYLQPGGAATPEAPPGTIYTCPMDPEARQDHPGACPVCGMALEPDLSTVVGRVEWTCPMHPEIVRSEPGSCPICGMALEPKVGSADEEQNPELAGMTRRFWISVVLTIPVVIAAMGEMIP